MTAFVAQHDLAARAALALSVLQHRPWCEHCAPHADTVTLALQGATITELADLQHTQQEGGGTSWSGSE